MKTYEHRTFKELETGLLARGPLVSLKKHLPEMKSTLSERLGDEFSLLINFPLAGTDIHIPLVLSGPPGIQVLTPIDLRGSYRAREGDWLAYSVDRNSFLPERENLVSRAVAYSQAVQKFLRENGLNASIVEPVMLFLDPMITVDTARPSARVLLWGGLGQYARNLAAARMTLSTEDLFNINSMLARGRRPGDPETRPRPATGSLHPKTAPRPATGSLHPKTTPRPAGRPRRTRLIMLGLAILLFFAVAAAIVVLYVP